MWGRGLLSDEGDKLRQEVADKFLVRCGFWGVGEERATALGGDVEGIAVAERVEDVVGELGELRVVGGDDVNSGCEDNGGGHESVADARDCRFAAEPIERSVTKNTNEVEWGVLCVIEDTHDGA